MRNKKGNPIRHPNPVLHIFCEGEKTEPNYLRRYKDLFCPNHTRAIRIEETKKNTPVQLVQEAVNLKKSRLVTENDQYWVVCDRESPAKYDETLHAKARNLAHAHGINIALSNVCFEVWLLLHKNQSCPSCNSCEELMKTDAFRNAFPAYRKGDACTLTKEAIETARENAEGMNERTINGADKEWIVPSKWNPYTDMPKLLDAIDAFCREHPHHDRA